MSKIKKRQLDHILLAIHCLGQMLGVVNNIYTLNFR